MKKIMFNDKYHLTQLVIIGAKTMTRRIIPQPPYKNYDIAFPNPLEAFDNNLPISHAFCWVNVDNKEEHTEWIRPQWRVGEVVAVAQSYKDCIAECLPLEEEYICEIISKGHKGWTNKMFVQASLMPHKIQITNIRLQRLQRISDEECLKEGVGQCSPSQTIGYPFGISFDYFIGENKKECRYTTPREAFAALIDGICGKGTWEQNPYVFVYDFVRV